MAADAGTIWSADKAKKKREKAIKNQILTDHRSAKNEKITEELTRNHECN